MPCFKFEVTINFDAEGDDPSKNDITQFITRMIKLHHATEEALMKEAFWKVQGEK